MKCWAIVACPFGTMPWLAVRGLLVGFALLLASSVCAASPSPLADAVEKSDRTAIRALLKNRADLNAAQPDGMTALHWAVHLDDLDTTRLLVKAGAEVHRTNLYGVAPLSLACANGNGELVELLL